MSKNVLLTDEQLEKLINQSKSDRTGTNGKFTPLDDPRFKPRVIEAKVRVKLVPGEGLSRDGEPYEALDVQFSDSPGFFNPLNLIWKDKETGEILKRYESNGLRLFPPRKGEASTV